MKLGISTGGKDEQLLEIFDVVMYGVKPSSGREAPPTKWWSQAIPVVSAFGHTKASVRNPNLAAISKEGLLSLPGKSNPRDGFAWGWVCPNAEGYREELLQFISQVAETHPKGLHLESVCFPDENYCYCQRCQDKFKSSDLEWHDWRTGVITGFIASVRERVKQPLSLTVHPDPYFLRERFGLDLNRLAPWLSFCLVPIYDLRYDLTYWIDTLLYAFVRLCPLPLWVELYAVEPDARGLARALATVCKYPVEGIIFYDHKGKYKQLARLFREDSELRSLVEGFPDKALKEVTERLADIF